MKVSIVIPALNEEGIVGKTVQSIPIENLKELGLKTEIIVVDNASTDETALEASEAGATVIYEEKEAMETPICEDSKKLQEILF